LLKKEALPILIFHSFATDFIHLLNTGTTTQTQIHHRFKSITMQRRDFIKMGSIIAATTSSAVAFAGKNTGIGKAAGQPMDFQHDGLQLSPKEYGALLMKLADEGKIKPDNYSNGGVVEEMEAKFAGLLGKEAAVFMPTGTLANHIAVRHLSGTNRKIIVQEQSHLYNDCGDCSQTLSGLNLVPLGTDTIEFSLQEIETLVAKIKKGRVETRIGAISLETPVRRQFDQIFSDANIKAISAYAKKNEINMHLDGARIFKQSAHTGTTPAQYGEMFDTVYTSLWKCFNASSGAVLAGSKAFTEKLFHERRMFGGSLPAAWAFAAVALHFSDSFLADYKKAWQNAEIFFAGLQKNDRFEIVKYEKGTHIVILRVRNTDLPKFKQSLARNNISIADPGPDGKSFYLKVNTSINKYDPQELVKLFTDALKG
jgi:threonine aldolase